LLDAIKSLFNVFDFISSNSCDGGGVLCIETLREFRLDPL
jgi:hypothetical protein